MRTIDISSWHLSGRNDLPEVIETEAPPVGASLFTLDQVKVHLRLDDGGEEDTYLALITSAATSFVEKVCNMSFLPRTVTVLFSDWPHCSADFRWPVRPIRSVEAVRYYNGSNVLTTIDPGDYRFRALKTGAMLAPLYDQNWPDTLDDRYPIEIDLKVGYAATNPGDPPAEQVFPVPDVLKCAVLLVIGDLYENRESQAVSTRIYSSMFQNMTFRRLVGEYRLRRVW